MKKFSMISKTLEPNGPIKEELQTMKSIQVRILVLIRLPQDSITIRSFMVKVLSLMCQGQANILLNLIWKSIPPPNLKMRLEPLGKQDLAHSSSLEAKLWRRHQDVAWSLPLSLIARTRDSSQGASRHTIISMEQALLLDLDNISIWKIQWSKRASIWVWNTVISYELLIDIQYINIHMLYIMTHSQIFINFCNN